ncbi:hypothetical protein ABPG72_000994 [Tetrahymena utriculariae]
MILQLFEFFSLLFAVGYLVNEYSDKQVKKHIKILSFVAWLLSFGFVFIIPLDIYWTLENQRFIDNCKQNPQSEQCISFDGDSIPEFKTMVWVWRAVYWITFIFTWFILPFFQDYEAAGEFDVQGRVKRSIKINLMIILGIGAIGLLFIVYLLISGKISWDNMEGFLIGLANGFGIFLVVILLGHGLVMIPKKCWRERNEETIIKLCQFQASKLDETKLETVFKLEEKVKFLQLAQQRYKEFEAYFNQIIDLVPADIVSHCKELNQPSESTRQDLNSFGVINVNKLASLNKETKQLVQQLKREQTKWDYLLDKAFFTEDLKKNKDSSENKIDSEFYVNRQGKLGHFIDVAYWFWNCKAKQIFMIICAFTFGMLSLLVLLGEISIFSGKVINPFHYILVDDTTHLIGTQFLLLIPLLYITFCVYSSMFQVKLANLFGLYKYHQTDAPSLMFFSINFARVSAPISYNYLKILGVKDSAFERIIGAMDDVPILGSANTYFFPMILIMLILFNAFDVYSKILSSLGLKQFEFSDNFDDERIDQGKQLIQRARNSWAKKFDKMKQSSPSQYAGYNTASSLRENEQIKNFGRGYGNNSDVSGDTEQRASVQSASTSSSQKYIQAQQSKLKQSIGNKYQNFSNFEEILEI